MGTMNRKRERLEVIWDILHIVRENRNSIRPTPLLRKSNLSSSSFADYYAELLAKGFIVEIPEKNGMKYISLTDKGFEYLQKYDLILGFIREFDL